MRGRVIWTVAAKDLHESTATGQVLAPVAIVPFVFVVLYPVGLLLALRSMSAADAHELIAKIPASAFPGTADLTVQGQAAYIATVYLFAGFFLIIPTMVAVVLAANSFAGEKERHTLEGVLYTPVSDTRAGRGQDLWCRCAGGAAVLGVLRRLRASRQCPRQRPGRAPVLPDTQLVGPHALARASGR